MHNCIDPPTISVHPESINKPADNSVTFHCSATGYPLPNLTWFKNDSEIFLEVVDIQSWQSGTLETSSNLTLSGLSEYDTAGYYCLASNNFVSFLNQTSHIAVLTVLCEQNLLVCTIIIINVEYLKLLLLYNTFSLQIQQTCCQVSMVQLKMLPILTI